MIGIIVISSFLPLLVAEIVHLSSASEAPGLAIGSLEDFTKSSWIVFAKLH